MPSHRILVVDDEDTLREGILAYLRSNGFEVAEARSCAGARELFQSFKPDVAVIDYLLGDGNALDLLPGIRESDPDTPILILTSHGSIDLAVRAMKEGADQFLTKPLEFSALLVLIRRALEKERVRRKLAASRSRDSRDSIEPFLGTSAAIRQLASDAGRIVKAESPVLIQGETGTGKSLLARWLHNNGPRADEAFVEFNCAGLSRELVETEFFGHERGAFTGAVAAKMGLLEVAHRGTVFLDELGDMDVQIQPKLLKVLEEKRFRRVGELRDRQVDVRLIAATHQDLEALVKQKLFRADLFFRVSTIPLVIPPLRDRIEDLIPLAHHLVSEIAIDLGAGPIELSRDAEQALAGYSWPGNIRELRNVLERAILLRDGVVLTPRNLRFAAPAEQNAGAGVLREDGDTHSTLAENERRHIVRVLESTGGSVVAAAKVLGLSRSSMYERLKKHSIDPSAAAASMRAG